MVHAYRSWTVPQAIEFQRDLRTLLEYEFISISFKYERDASLKYKNTLVYYHTARLKLYSQLTGLSVHELLDKVHVRQGSTGPNRVLVDLLFGSVSGICERGTETIPDTMLKSEPVKSYVSAYQTFLAIQRALNRN